MAMQFPYSHKSIIAETTSVLALNLDIIRGPYYSQRFIKISRSLSTIHKAVVAGYV